MAIEKKNSEKNSKGKIWNPGSRRSFVQVCTAIQPLRVTNIWIPIKREILSLLILLINILYCNKFLYSQ